MLKAGSHYPQASASDSCPGIITLGKHVERAPATPCGEPKPPAVLKDVILYHTGIQKSEKKKKIRTLKHNARLSTLANLHEYQSMMANVGLVISMKSRIMERAY